MFSSLYSPSHRFPGCWISESAVIGAETLVLPGCIIGDRAKIGSNNIIGPNVIIEGAVHIGSRNILMPGVVIGMPSRERIRSNQSTKQFSLDPVIHIGDGNIFQENVSVRLPIGDGTIVEDNVAIGANTHVAHDCFVRRYAIIGPNCTLGGYVTIGSFANIGLGVNIHPRTAIGSYAMCGLASGITRHVAPGATVVGVPARFLKPNVRGMQRHGLSAQEIDTFCRILDGDIDSSVDSKIHEFFLEFDRDMRRWGRLVDSLPAWRR